MYVSRYDIFSILNYPNQIFNNMSLSYIYAITFILAVLSFYFFKQSKIKISLLLLFVASLCLRLFFVYTDNYLHDWDERFHALVAKNMMEYPFQPMLRVNPVLDYDYTAWCCNHIWLHKQPFFLWQMALSMKIFGVNTFALRLPSAIMGALLIFPTFQNWQTYIQRKYRLLCLFFIGFCLLSNRTHYRRDWHGP